MKSRRGFSQGTGEFSSIKTINYLFYENIVVYNNEA